MPTEQSTSSMDGADAAAPASTPRITAHTPSTGDDAGNSGGSSSGLADMAMENARLKSLLEEKDALVEEKDALLIEKDILLEKKDAELTAVKQKLHDKTAEVAILKNLAAIQRGGDEGGGAAAAAEEEEEEEEEEDEAHTAELPPALRTFKILADYPAVVRLITGEGDERRIGLENAVATNPSNAEALAELAVYVAELQTATQNAIDASLAEPGLFKRAFEAMVAGNNTFIDVYQSVWKLVEAAELASVQKYKARVTAAAAKLPKEKQQQTVSTIHELFRDAAVVKPRFDVMVKARLYNRLRRKRKDAARGARLKLCTAPKALKRTTRLCEKFAFAGTAALISDVVRAMLIVKTMDGVDAALEMLLELEAEGLITIVRLKDRFCTMPSSGGWRDLMVNFTIEGDETHHICELQVVHENMLTAREGLPGHAVYNRVRNAVELLGKRFGSAGAAGDALALAGVLVGMGGGHAVGKEGFVESRESNTVNTSYKTEPVHRDHISGKGVFLADKGWLSEAPLQEWMGVRVDESTGRVTHVELKDKGLVGPIPKVLADLTELEYLDLRDNGALARPPGLDTSEAHPTGELGLLDMTGQVHYTAKERCQQFLQHLKLSSKEQWLKVDEAQLVAKHGPDGPALWKIFEANEKFPGWNAAADRQRWFEAGADDVCKWAGVVVDGKKVVGLSLKGFGFMSLPSELGLLVNLASLDLSCCDHLVVNGSSVWLLVNLASLKLEYCMSLTTLPSEIGQLVNLASLKLSGCTSLATLPSEIGLLVNLAGLDLSGCKSLTTLPSEIGLLVNLASLKLEYCDSLTTVPSEIGQLVNLASLDLSYCDQLVVNGSSVWQLVNLVSLDLTGCWSLTTLPSEIGLLVNLASLKLSGCTRMATLPSEIGLLVNLASLDLSFSSDLSGCKSLTTLPSEIGLLVNLASMKLGGCTSLATLPSEIGLLVNLAGLDLSRCSSLTTVPSEIGQLVNLASLDLSGCDSLSSLPSEIGELVNLASLDLNRCSRLATLPSEIGQLVNLASLDLSGCDSLSSLPSEIGELVNLASLDLSGCDSLSSLPSEIGLLVNLAGLDLSRCSSLTTVPSEIGQLVNLVSLHLSSCSSWTTLPSVIGELVNLASLDLNRCSRLATLPSEIGQLVNLASLYLSGCKSLTTLPSEIGLLVNLASLKLEYCDSLTTVPSEIGQLVNLASLDLSYCSSLTTLPSEIGQLVNLATLDLRYCSSLTTLPSEIGQLVNLALLGLNSCTSIVESEQLHELDNSAV